MTQSVRPGTILARKYEVIRVVGEGGMGVVYQARRLADGAMVALKVLREEFMKDLDAVTRFQREAGAAATLTSQHVAKILDFGVIETGQPFMALEFLEGHDLMTEIENRGTIPVGEAAWYVAQATFAMIEAHEQGIVHRDLKPPNLFLTKDASGRPLIKVLDFGISKIQRLKDARLTSTQMSFGTPLYMSPEQIRSTKLVDHRSDIWSLGVILYEAITGEPPFMAETAGALAVTISVEKHVPPSQLRPGIPPAMDDVIAGTLHKDPKQRYQSAQEFLRALEDFVPSDAYSRTQKGAMFATMVDPRAAASAVREASALAANRGGAGPATQASAPLHAERSVAPTVPGSMHGAPMQAHMGAPMQSAPVHAATNPGSGFRASPDGTAPGYARSSFAELPDARPAHKQARSARKTSRAAALVAIGVALFGVVALAGALFAWSRQDRAILQPMAFSAAPTHSASENVPTVTPVEPSASALEPATSSSAPASASSDAGAPSTAKPSASAVPQGSDGPPAKPKGKPKTAGTAYLPNTP